MTDITELAQSIKVAAERATPGPWLRSGVIFNGITNINNPFEQDKKPHIAHTSEKRDAEFIALANPANVLALLERIAELEAIVNTPVNLPSIGGKERYAWSDGVFNYREDVVLALTRHGLAHGLTVQED